MRKGNTRRGSYQRVRTFLGGNSQHNRIHFEPHGREMFVLSDTFAINTSRAKNRGADPGTCRRAATYMWENISARVGLHQSIHPTVVHSHKKGSDRLPVLMVCNASSLELRHAHLANPRPTVNEKLGPPTAGSMNFVPFSCSSPRRDDMSFTPWPFSLCHPWILSALKYLSSPSQFSSLF
jgi:hypothetical protein